MDTLTAIFFLLFILTTIGILYAVRSVRVSALKKWRPSMEEQLQRKAEEKLKQHPNNRDALRTLSDIYYKNEEWAKAHRIYRTLYGDRPITSIRTEQEFTQRLQHGISAYMSKDANQGHIVLSTLTERTNKPFEFFWYYGLCNYEKRHFMHAMSNFNRAQQLQPNNIEVRKYIAYTNHKLNNITLARNQLEAIHAHDSDPEISCTLGTVYFKAGENDKALEIFSQLAKTDSYTTISFIMMGEIYRKRNDTQQSLTYYNKALKSARNIDQALEAEVLYQMGVLLKEQGKQIAALKKFTLIKQQMPNYQDAQKMISQLALSIGDYALNRYLQADPVERDAAIRKLIPLLIGEPVSHISSLYTTDQGYLDYQTQISGQEKKTPVTILLRFSTLSGTIGEISVRELFNKMNEKRFRQAVFVATGEFTSSAAAFAIARTVGLCDGKKLQLLLKQVIE